MILYGAILRCALLYLNSRHNAVTSLDQPLGKVCLTNHVLPAKSELREASTKGPYVALSRSFTLRTMNLLAPMKV
jgi:hypothetical protein